MTDPHDPKGLVREAFLMDGISAADCRSILLDWALSLPPGADPRLSARNLLEGRPGDGHPMIEVLRAALHPAPEPRRRGGRSGRVA